MLHHPLHRRLVQTVQVRHRRLPFRPPVATPPPQNLPQRPLAGLLAAFDWAGRQDPPVEAVVSVSTDTPFLPANLVARLNAHSDDGAAIASSEGRIHPVVGLWPVALRPVLETALSERRRSVEKFARLIEAVEVPFPHVTIGSRSVDPFFNANTPGDLELAREILQS